MENRVKKLNLGEIVSFAGWVNQQETLDYYRKADIFCFPSVREFGEAVVIEAMACGLPCIVANNGGIGEYVTTGTQLIIALDRTQWKEYNVLMVSVIYQKRAFPIFWTLLDKQGDSTLAEQQQVLRPIIPI